MRILILSGGTGSVALQKGLAELVNEDIKVQVLTNCYDNGLSTGAVRQVFDGNILGPSDLRKNQTLLMELSGVPKSILDFMAIRFDAKDWLEAEDQVLIDVGIYLMGDLQNEAAKAVRHFFKQPKSREIEYTDFSASNIVYAGLAALNGNSLSEAGRIMARLTGIPEDAVILNDDTSLFLEAVTESGHRILDEGDIVSWNNPDDPIAYVDFANDGKPVLSSEAKDTIAAADLIILSSGTQWSSLIPTYMSEGFSEAIRNSRAKVVMVMNKNPDKDAPEKNADDWIEIVTPYFPKDISVVLCSDDNASLGIIRKVHDGVDLYFTHPVENSNPKRHDPHALVTKVMHAYYGEKVEANHLVLDYDDTIAARKSGQNELAKEIRRIVEEEDATIISGNDRNKVIADVEYIYADRFSNLYVNGVFMRKLSDENPKDIEAIYEIVKSIPSTTGKRTYSRQGVSVVSKPYDNEARYFLCDVINEKLIDEFPNYEAKISGSTSIEVGVKFRSKLEPLNDIVLKRGKSFTYLGDEFQGDGNDVEIFEAHPERCVEVKGIGDTLMFLKVYQRIKYVK